MCKREKARFVSLLFLELKVDETLQIHERVGYGENGEQMLGGDELGGEPVGARHVRLSQPAMLCSEIRQWLNRWFR